MMISDPDKSRVQILVIEDNPADVELLQLALANAALEYDLKVIDDGAEALRFFRGEGQYASVPRPDLAVLDLNLPKYDGLQILEAARANRAFESTPIAILSSSSSPRERSKLQMFPLVRFITKPVDLDQYLAVGEAIRGFLRETSIRPR